jgi:acetyltransferase-like isoleucine patch superfamily enzyme
MVLGGVTMGDRSVIRAESLVTEDILPDLSAAGNPARLFPKKPKH